MITGLRNMMAAPFRVREIGPHVHEWVKVGVDAEGEEYQQCARCDARRNVTRARFEAKRQDWLNYLEPWSPEAAPIVAAAPIPEPVEAPDPPKRKPGRPRKTA